MATPGSGTSLANGLVSVGGGRDRAKSNDALLDDYYTGRLQAAQPSRRLSTAAKSSRNFAALREEELHRAFHDQSGGKIPR